MHRGSKKLPAILFTLEELQRAYWQAKCVLSDDTEPTYKVKTDVHFDPHDLDTAFVNSLALLLVTEAQDDVAAVSASIEPEALNIFVSKGRPFNNAELCYFGSFQKAVQKIAKFKKRASDEAMIDLRLCVIEGCRKKLLNHLDKLQVLLKSSPDKLDTGKLGSDNLEAVKAIFRSENIAQMLGPLDSPQNCVEVQWMRARTALSEISHQSSVQELRAVLSLGFYLGNDLLEPLIGPDVVRQFKKFGTYQRAIRVITVLAGAAQFKKIIGGMKLIDIHAEDSKTAECRNNLFTDIARGRSQHRSARENRPRKRPRDSRSQSPERKSHKTALPSPSSDRRSEEPDVEQMPSEPPYSSMSTFPRPRNPHPTFCSSSRHNRAIDDADKPQEVAVTETLKWVAESSDLLQLKECHLTSLLLTFQHITWKYSPRDLKIHAECALAVYLRAKYPSRKLFYIGVSKPPCWACDTWLEAYQTAFQCKLKIRETEGKYCRHWRSPAGCAFADEVLENTAYSAICSLSKQFHDCIWAFGQV
ncbi:hypothetical protein TWF696_008513 [Orbilia brochopaga]|uniref:Uncharacterized protein n=1 Tax=Orbilia brochopaga TaxID=3140254 RepID=A0AAV9UGG0_9PEZI